MPTDYDRLNPATKAQGLNTFMEFLKKGRKSPKKGDAKAFVFPELFVKMKNKGSII